MTNAAPSAHLPRVAVERRGAVAHVVLSNGARHNAIDWPMLSELVSTARALASDRTLRAVILRGEGASFCSGLDFPRFTKQPGRIVQAFAKLSPGKTNLFQEACWAWRRVPVPVIAVLHGRCYGGGLQVALAADFRLSTPDCELSVLEAKWGLVPDMSGTVALRELVGIDQAKLLTYTGRVVSGQEALAIGLVTQVHDDPLAAAERLVEELVARSPDAVAAAKDLLQQNWADSEANGLARERRLQMLVLAGRNFREALRANFGERPPSFGKRSPLL